MSNTSIKVVARMTWDNVIQQTSYN